MTEHIWFIWALLAAIFWGLGYALDEVLLNSGISPISVAFFHSIPMLLLLGIIWFFYSPDKDINILSTNKSLIIVLLIATTAFALGSLLIYTSIAEKNAALATIVEISYPLFVALFSYVLFKNVEITLWSIIGFLLIISGVVLIYLKH